MKKTIITLALLSSMPIVLAQSLDIKSTNSSQKIVLNQDNWSGMIDKTNSAKNPISTPLSAELIKKRKEDSDTQVKPNPENRLGGIGGISESNISTKLKSTADKLLEVTSIIFLMAIIPFIFRLVSQKK